MGEYGLEFVPGGVEYLGLVVGGQGDFFGAEH